VPAVLLGLGGLCLVVGALVFLAVTWSVLGIGGRTAVLVGLTLVAALGVALSARRGLRGAAETLAAVAGLFLAADLAGAAAAGWLGGVRADDAALGCALVVALVPALGNHLLRTLPTGVLVAPQAIAAAAALIAACAALVRYGDHLTSTTTVTILVLATAADGARRARQRVLAWGAGCAALAMWSALVMEGAARVLAAWDSDGRGAPTWVDVEPMLVATGLAAAVVAAPYARGRTVGVPQQLAALVVSWLLPATVTTVVVETGTALVIVAVAATIATAAVGRLLPALADACRIAAIGLAAVASFVAATAVAVLGSGVSHEVFVQVGAAHPDLLATATLGSFHDAAPWVLPLAALAIAVAAPLRRARHLLALAAPVAAATALCYAPALLLVTAAAVLLAAAHVVPGRALWGRSSDLVVASCWTALAGASAVYHPAPAAAVALLVTAVAAVHVRRTGSVVGQVALPALVATSAGAVCWLLEVPGPWAAGVAVVAAAALTVALCSHVAGYAAALVTCLVAGGLGAADAGSAVDGWVAAYLSLAAAGSAAVAIKGRAPGAAWLAAVLELVATWVRLGAAGVETPEAYTLPLAGVLLGFGGWTLWRDRDAGTMRTLAPGLVTALVPTLVLAAGDPVSLRALVLAGGCALLVATGAARQWRAALLAGASTGAALVVAELVPYHDAVPRWLLLSVAGACLVLAGVRWEYLAGLGRRGWGRVAELR
jgi:hypothetical protein